MTHPTGPPRPPGNSTLTIQGAQGCGASSAIQPGRRWTLAAPLWPLLPALVLIPVLLLLPSQVHGGGWEAIGQFLLAAGRPSVDPLVLRSALQGLTDRKSTRLNSSHSSVSRMPSSA